MFCNSIDLNVYIKPNHLCSDPGAEHIGAPVTGVHAHAAAFC